MKIDGSLSDPSRLMHAARYKKEHVMGKIDLNDIVANSPQPGPVVILVPDEILNYKKQNRSKTVRVRGENCCFICKSNNDRDAGGMWRDDSGVAYCYTHMRRLPQFKRTACAGCGTVNVGDIPQEWIEYPNQVTICGKCRNK